MENRTMTSKAFDTNMIDPVCGMRVSQGRKGLMTTYRENRYYFCADSCRRAFEANPEKYVRPPKRKGLWGRYLKRLNRVTHGKQMACH